MKIENAAVFSENGSFINKTVYTSGEYFSEKSIDQIEIDAQGSLLIPGLIDVHFHGCAGSDFCDATPEALHTIAAEELMYGVTTICPASMTLPEDELLTIFENAAAFAKAPKKEPLARLKGIHLEGPFISPAKKGAQNEDFIKKPETAMFQQLQEASGNLIKLITIAPEVDGALDFIESHSSLVHISLGHTSSNYETAMRAFERGASHMTHLYNAMPGLTHREPGPIGAAIDSENVMVEVICDGIHIHPAIIRATFKLFGDERVILVSDSMRAAGMKDGSYTLGGQEVTVEGRFARLKDGTIAGSVTNLMECMRTAVSMGIPLESAVKGATINPARSIGIDEQYGSIEEGKFADCLLLDPESLAIKTIILGGNIVFTAPN